MLIRALREAGPVRSGGAIGGRTIQELAKVLTEQRGRLVKEGTVCGRLAELRCKQLASDSGAKRPGACGVPCTVYVHHEHVQPNRRNSNDAGQRTPTRQERLAELRKRIRALFYQLGIEVCGPVFAEQDLAFVGAVDRIADPRRLEAILEALQASAKQERNNR